MLYYPKLKRMSSISTSLDVLILSNPKFKDYESLGISRTTIWRSRLRIEGNTEPEPANSRNLVLKLSPTLIKRYGLPATVYHTWRVFTSKNSGHDPNIGLAVSILGFSKRSIIKYRRVSDMIQLRRENVIDIDDLKSRITKKHKEKLLSKKKTVASDYAALFKAMAVQHKQNLIPPTVKDIAIAKRIDNLLRQANSSLAALLEYAFENWATIQSRCKIHTVPSMSMILRHYRTIFEMMERPKAEIVQFEYVPKTPAKPSRRTADQMTDEEIDYYNQEAM